jgi:uncharacterized UPF0160 family protein
MGIRILEKLGNYLPGGIDMKVGTHDGLFHADDVFACAVLSLLMLRRDGSGIHVVRTRDQDILASCYIVVDVGCGKYDHHQGGVMPRPNGVPYASFGLIWREYGEELCGSGEVAQNVDYDLVQGIDASDNAFQLSKGRTVEGVSNFSISAVISSFNPSWDESQPPGTALSEFYKAMLLAETLLARVIKRAQGELKAVDIVHEAIGKAVDPRLIVLEQFVPWMEIVTTRSEQALYVMFPSNTGEWRLQCVPSAIGSFSKRKPLPANWAGLNNEDLVKVTGVADATFCHKGQFICGAKTREGIRLLAMQALEA